MLKNLYLLLLCTWAMTSTFAQEANKWTPADIINTEYLSSPSFSPDNQMVVWSKRKAVKKKDRFVSDLYLTRLGVQKDGAFLTVQLTNGTDSDYSPLFSSNGETIYFLSSREEGKKLWSMSIYGGEPKAVHTFKNGISSIDWLNDSTLTFVSNEGKTLYEQQLKEQKDNTVVVEDSAHWTISRVFSFGIQDKKIKRLTDNEYPIRNYEVSKDGKWLISSLTMSRHFASDANPDPKHYLYNLQSGEKKEILQGLQEPGRFQFSHDSRSFYFTAVKSSDPEWNGAGIYELYEYDVYGDGYQQINLRWENGAGGGYSLAGEYVVASLSNRATRRIATYKKQNNRWVQSFPDFDDKADHVTIRTISEDGKKVVYEYSTASQLPVYYVADIAASGNGLKFENEQELVVLNKALKNKPKTRYEVFTWKGWNGEEVNGLLYYPENYEEGKRYPLMLSIHGGPSAVDLDSWRERWSTYPNILAQRGAFVLKPNYHGSSNHGLAFVESIKKNYYTPELTDITKGIEALDKKGLIDMDKLGTMGWSNGAIITTMLTVRYPDMFKVACPGAGDVNWTSDFGTCRFGVSFDQSYFGGAPWDDVNGTFFNETYIRQSPLFEMDKVKTPTLIFHGSEDRAVPRDQGWEYYRSLQQIGQAPVRFLWFPGQPHGLQKITHQLRKMNEELAWIDKYLFGKEEVDNEAFKKGSPLAMLLKKQSASKHEGLYGVQESDNLLPEMVAIAEDGLSLGRFEVTNAQFASFEEEHNYPKDEGNFPALVSYEKAQNYITWLNQETGKTYRLPQEKEADKWHKKAIKSAGKANTLAYWAGYDITKDDVPAFREKLAEAKTSLLKPVGSFPPIKIGNAEVYDLAGNAAEYFGDAGEVYGFDAASFVDPHNADMPKTSIYRGFRVVLAK